MISSSYSSNRAAGSASILFLMFALPALFFCLGLISQFMWYSEQQAKDQATVDAIALRASRLLPNFRAAEAEIKSDLPQHLKGLTVEGDSTDSSISIYGTLSTPTLFSRLIPESKINSISRFVRTTVRIPPQVTYVALDTSSYMAPATNLEADSMDTRPASYFEKHKDAALQSARCFNGSFLTMKRAAIEILRSFEGMHSFSSATGIFGHDAPSMVETISRDPRDVHGGQSAYTIAPSAHASVRPEECAYAAETEAAIEGYKMPTMWRYEKDGLKQQQRTGPLVDPGSMTISGSDPIHMEESVWSLPASNPTSERPNYALVIEEIINKLIGNIGHLNHLVGDRSDMVGVILAGGSPFDTPNNNFENTLQTVKSNVVNVIGAKNLHISIVFVYYPSAWNQATPTGEELAATFARLNSNQNRIKFSVLYAPNAEILNATILPRVKSIRNSVVIAR